MEDGATGVDADPAFAGYDIRMISMTKVTRVSDITTRT